MMKLYVAQILFRRAIPQNPSKTHPGITGSGTSRRPDQRRSQSLQRTEADSYPTALETFLIETLHRHGAAIPVTKHFGDISRRWLSPHGIWGKTWGIAGGLSGKLSGPS